MINIGYIYIVTLVIIYLNTFLNLKGFQYWYTYTTYSLSCMNISSLNHRTTYRSKNDQLEFFNIEHMSLSMDIVSIPTLNFEWRVNIVISHTVKH